MDNIVTINNEQYQIMSLGLLKSLKNGIVYKQELSEEAGTPILSPQIEIAPQEDNYPLGHYGKAIMKYMEETSPDRLDELMLDGTLMSRLHSREDELTELKLSIMEQMEKKNPRPITDNFIEVAQHLEQIQTQAEEMVREELYKAI